MKIQELFLITLISLIGASFASALEDKPRRGLRTSAAQTAPRKLDDEDYEYEYYYTDDDTDDEPVDDAAEDAEYYYYEDNGDTVPDDAAEDADYYYYEDNGDTVPDRRLDEEYYYDDDEEPGDELGDDVTEIEVFGNTTVNAAAEDTDDDYYDYENDDGELF